MSPEPDCNICGKDDVDKKVEFGTQRGESGTIGLSMCVDCWEAARWHDENASDRCFSCSKEGAKPITLAEPARRGPDEATSFELSLCRDCSAASGGLLGAHDSDVGFRAIANITTEWDDQRNAALFRDHHTCQECGDGDPWLHVHHEIPRSEGGTDHLNNLVSLCPDCHADRHNTAACDLCSSISFAEHNATWIDESGGAPVTFCDDCTEYLERAGSGGGRCAICGAFRSRNAKSEYIYFQGKVQDGEVPSFTACDDCRKAAVFGSVAEKQQYFHEELPDSHADIRHWEVSGDV
jgi:hypothetical protein